MKGESITFLDDTYTKHVAYDGCIIKKIVVVDGSDSNVDYGFSSDSSWVTVKKDRNIMNITVNPNNTEEKRECVIKVWNKKNRNACYFNYTIYQEEMVYHISTSTDAILDFNQFPCKDEYSGCSYEEIIVDVHVGGGSGLFGIIGVKEYDKNGNEIDYDEGITVKRKLDDDGSYKLHIYNYGILFDYNDLNYYIVTICHMDKPTLQCEVKMAYDYYDKSDDKIYVNGDEVLDTSKTTFSIPYNDSTLTLSVNIGGDGTDDKPYSWDAYISDDCTYDDISISKSMYNLNIEVGENTTESERTIGIVIVNTETNNARDIEIKQSFYTKSYAPIIIPVDYSGIKLLDENYEPIETSYYNAINIGKEATEITYNIYTLIYDKKRNEITDSALIVNNDNRSWVSDDIEMYIATDTNGDETCIKKLTLSISENTSGITRSCYIIVKNAEDKSQALKFEITQSC